MPEIVPDPPRPCDAMHLKKQALAGRFKEIFKRIDMVESEGYEPGKT
jgi:hypothetical protein